LKEFKMIVITGATSNTGKAVAASLLDAGARIRVIGRNLERLGPFVDRGAEPFEAEPTDAEAMRRAFKDASAAYVMLQPGYSPESNDFPAYLEMVIDAVVPALKPAGIRHVVALSGWGANYPESTGPLAGLRKLETRLAISGVPNVLALRAGWFMENADSMIEELRTGAEARGALRGDLKLPMIATSDVGKTAARYLLALDFSGFETKEVQGPEELTLQEATAIAARLVGRAGARYEQVPPERVLAGLLSAGFTRHMANAFLEISEDVNKERIRMLRPVAERIVTGTRFEDFVKSLLGKKEAA
jgi:uncharacterized protein YbjT (DUF2867 family)